MRGCDSNAREYLQGELVQQTEKKAIKIIHVVTTKTSNEDDYRKEIATLLSSK